MFSFFSYALPLAALQFVIQPIIASRLGAELNGQFLTLMSINYFLIGITATVLNTVRMLQHEEYRKQGYVGDFNIYFSVYALTLLVVMPILFVVYTGRLNAIDILLYVIVGILYLYHDYIFAQYRLELKYGKILINNVIIVVGYFIGLAIFFRIGYWQIVVITAYLLSGIYDFFNTTFLREPIRKTPLLKDTSRKILYYTGSNVLSSFVTYCDKLLLYPLLGGALVSVYSTATMVGKLLLLLSSPLSSVLLSYLVRAKTFRIKLSAKWIALIALGGCAAYLGCLLVGYPLTDLLYPDWAAESQKYIPVTILGSMLGLLIHLLNTIVIRFFKASFQMKFQAANLIVYLVVCLTLLHFFSLWGFCIGVVLTNFIRLVVLMVVISKLNGKEKTKCE